MRYFHVFLLAISTIYSAKVEAEPLAYQQCVDAHLEQFRKDEIDASKDLLNSLAELREFPEMQHTVKKNYEFGLILRRENLDLALKISKVLCTD